MDFNEHDIGICNSWLQKIARQAPLFRIRTNYIIPSFDLGGRNCPVGFALIILTDLNEVYMNKKLLMKKNFNKSVKCH